MLNRKIFVEKFDCSLPEGLNEPTRQRLEKLLRFIRSIELGGGVFRTAEVRSEKKNELIEAMGDTISENEKTAKSGYWKGRMYLDLKRLESLGKIYSVGSGRDRCFYLGDASKASMKQEKDNKIRASQSEATETTLPIKLKLSLDIDVNVRVNTFAQSVVKEEN